MCIRDSFSAVLESFKAEAEAHGDDITFLNHNVCGKPTTYLQHCRCLLYTSRWV